MLGETEWTKNGRYTGISELDLTPNGVKQVTGTATHLVGPGKLMDPARLVHVWVSPRKRTQQTYNLLFGTSGAGDNAAIDAGKVIITEDIAEWNYGDYEGLRVNEIRLSRKERKLDQEEEWNIWRDGCEGGEYASPSRNRSFGLLLT